jgi:hypothetical protein
MRFFSIDGLFELSSDVPQDISLVGVGVAVAIMMAWAKSLN